MTNPIDGGKRPEEPKDDSSAGSKRGRNRSIFRQNAVKHKTDRLYGDVLVFPRISHSIVLAVILFVVAAILAILARGTFYSKEFVRGWLEPVTGVARVYVDGGGVIEELLVAEGDEVVAGQRLATVSRETQLESGDQLAEVLLFEYAAQESKIREQIDRLGLVLDSNTKELRRKIAAAQEELSLLRDQESTIGERYHIVQQAYRRLLDVQSQGFVTPTQVERAKQEMLTVKSEQETFQRQMMQQENLVLELVSALATLPDEHSSNVASLELQLMTIKRETAEILSRNSQVITAPKSGVIDNVQVFSGQYVQSKVLLFSIVPLESKLTAQMIIPVRSAGFVAPGQLVEIRYDSFPYQKYGVYSARVVGVGETVVLPGELLSAPIEITEPVYRVATELDQSSIDAFGRQIPVKSGMTFTAVIRLEQRTFIEWLFEPLFTAVGDV